MPKISITPENVLKRYPEGRLCGRLKALKRVKKINDLGKLPMSEQELNNLDTEIRNVQDELGRR